jgi:hypothetical protein
LREDRRRRARHAFGIGRARPSRQTELAGRLLRRIGHALAETDRERAAVITGAGVARSQSSTLTERVKRYHRERVAVLEELLGADRCNALVDQGAAMTDNDAVRFAHAAADDALTDLAEEHREEE